MKLLALILSLVVLTLVNEGESSSLENSQCDFTCQGSEYFDYQQGMSYSYSYQAVVQNSFHDNAGSEQQSEIQINAAVVVDIISQCKHNLRITSASLNNPDQPDLDISSWETALTRNPLSFTRDDGVVKSLCASNSDPIWVMNIKRGILSALSVSSVDHDTDNVVESDIMGVCSTSEYMVTSTRGNKHITKEKDLSMCVNSNRPFGSFFTTLSAGAGNAIQQNQRCTQSVTMNGVIRSECTEEHTLRPFSNEDDGAMTNITQILALQSSDSSPYRFSSVGENDGRQTTLGFEDEMSQGSQQNINEVLDLYSKICRTMDTETFEEVSQDYVKMIFLLRRLDSSAIAQAYSSLNGACPAWESSLRAMFMDALRWCGSEGCVTYGAQLIAAGSDLFDEATSLQWLAAMSMIKEPTLPMIEAMADILQSGRFAEQAYLTTGSLVYGACLNDDNCLRHYAVRNALRFFEEKLGADCSSPSVDAQNTVLLAMKALGNAGRTTDSAVITACAKQTNNGGELRVAALQAFRRMPCGTDRAIDSLVFDRDEDSEIRINAYLTLMKCPTSTFISKIITMLDDEPSQQMASFVSTHLRALVASSDPLKGYIKPYLIEAAFAKTHDMDPRKFSRFYETSYYSDHLSAGATVEGSLIWSPRSFVPRSANLNLTANVFGQSINLLELGGRVEGVEQLLQDVMETQQFLQDTGIANIFGNDIEVEEEDDFDEPVNARKSKKAKKIPNIDKMKELNKQYENTLNKESLGASYFVRIFGNEVSYGNSHPHEVKKDIANQVSSFFEAIAQGQELRYHKNMAFATWAYTLPTGVGLPLTVAVNGSASLDVRVNGQMDFSNLLSANPEFAVNTEINPRSTIVINGAMTVDAHVTEAGIMTESSMMSGWRVSGRASLANGRRIKVRVDAPYQENSLFRFNHKLMKVAGEERVLMAREGSLSSSSECSSEYVGHALCFTSPVGDVSIFPESGSLTYALSVEKRDRDLTHFIFTANYDIEQDTGNVPVTAEAHIVFDTPGSRTNRHSELNLQFAREELRASASLQQPSGSSEVSGRITRESNGLSVSATYNSNGNENQLQGRFVNGLADEVPNFLVEASLARPGRGATLVFQTSASYSPMKMIAVHSSFTDLFTIDLGFEDKSSRTKLVYDGNALVDIPFYSNGVDFTVTIKPRYDNFAANVEYTMKGQSRRESIRIVHKHRDTSTDVSTSWSSEEKLLISEYSDYNLVAELSYSNDPDTLASTAKISYGSNAGNDPCRKCILVNQRFSIEGSTGESTNVEGSLDINIPYMSLEESVGFTLENSPSRVQVNLQFRGDDKFRFSSTTTGDSDHEIEMLTPTPWGSVTLSGTLQETSQSVHELSGGFNFGQSSDFDMRMSVVLTNQADHKKLAITVEGTTGNILELRSDNRYLAPAGFSTDNYLSTSYFSPISLSVQHEGQKEGGFETVFHFDYSPYLLGFSIDINSDSKNAITNVYYNDEHGEKQTARAEINYSNTPRTAGEMYYSGSVSIETDIRKSPFSHARVAGEFSRLNEVASISGDVEVENNKVLDFTVSSSFGSQFSLDADVSQNINPTMPRVIANLQVDVEAKQGSISISDGRNNLINANLEVGTTSARTTIQQSITELAPDRVEASFEFSHGQVTVNANLDGNTITLTGSMPNNNKLVCSLQQSIPKLLQLSVPRSTTMQTQWGTRRSDEKMGLWSTLTVDEDQECVFEALYGNQGTTYTVEFNFNPNEVRILRRSVASVSMAVELQTPNNEVHLQYSLLIDGVNRDSMTLDYESGIFNMECRQSIIPSPLIPSDIVVSAKWGDLNKAGVTVTIAGTETSLNGKAIVRSSPYVYADVDLGFMSNHPAIAGKYATAFSYDQSQENLATFSVSSNDDHEATLSLSWDLEARRMTFMATQNLYSGPTLPYNVRLNLEYTEAMRTTQVNMIYNSKHIRYNHEYEMENFDAEYEARVVQNISPIANDVKLSLGWATTSDSTTNGIVVKGSAAIDGGEAQTVEVGCESNFADPTQTYTVSFSQEVEALNQIWFAPADVTITLSYRGSAFGLNVVKQGESPVNMDMTADWSDGAVVVRHSLDNDGIARMSGWDKFRYATEVRVETNRIYASGEFQNHYEQNFEASADVSYAAIDSGWQVDTDLRTNVFDVLQFEAPFEIPTQVQTYSLVNYAYGGSSGGVGGNGAANTTITRVFANGRSQENKFAISADTKLFNYHVNLRIEHDFEDTPVPNILELEVQASSSNEKSTLFYRSGIISVTIDELIQSASMTLNYNPLRNKVYLQCKQNVVQILQYGIPGNMSVNFEGRSLTDFDLAVVYDTNRKSVGFNFDYIGDDNKLVTYVYHDFDRIENIGWPKKVGVELQGTLDTRDGTFNILTVFGADVREASSSFRWDGHSLATLHEVSFKHNQNFTDIDYVPNKSKASLSITEENFGFDARINLDGKEIRAKVNYEDIVGERTLQATFTQTFYKKYSKRYQVAATVNSEDSSLELKLKLDGRTKLTITGNFELDASEGSFRSHSEMEHKFDVPFPDAVDMIISGSYTNQGIAVNLDLTQNEDPTSSFSISSGGDSDEFFAQFRHNMIDSSIPADSRVDGTLLRHPGSVDLDLRISRGRSENAITLSSSWQLSDTAVFGAMSVSHDFEELSQIPRFIAVKSFLSGGNQQMIADLNVTVNEQLFQHLVSVSCVSKAGQFKYGVDMSHKNQYLTNLGVPEAAGATVQAQYGATHLSSELSATYVGQEASLRSSLSLNGNCKKNDYSIRYVNSFAMGDLSREDQLGARLNLNAHHPMIQLRLETPELARMGVPRDYTLQLIGNEQTVDWTARGEVDGEIVQLRVQWRKHPEMFVSLSAFQNQQYLTRSLQVPTNMSVEAEHQQDGKDYSCTAAVRYDNRFVEIGHTRDTGELATVHAGYMNTNIAELGPVQRRNWQNTHSYIPPYGIFTTAGYVIENDVNVFDYDFSLNTSDLEVIFNCGYLGIVDLKVTVDSSAFVDPVVEGEMTPMSIGMTMDNVDYLMKVMVRPISGGNEYEWSYNGGEVRFVTQLSITNSNFMSFSLRSSGCDYLPRSVTTSYSEPQEVRASWTHDNVQNLNLMVNTGRWEITGNNLDGDLLASIQGTHNAESQFTEVTFRVPSFGIHERLTSDFNMLGLDGNSTVTLSLEDMSTGNRGTVEFFAFLGGGDWGDIYTGVKLDSNYEILPYNVRVTLNSTLDKNANVWYYTLKAAGVGQDIVAMVIHGNGNVEVALHVGPSTYGLESQSSRGHTSVIKSTSIQWGGPNDRLDLRVEVSMMNLKNVVTVNVDQPSNAFGFDHFDITGETDLSSSRMSAKLSVNLNAFNAEAELSYEGAYPSLYGSHDVDFQLSYTSPYGKQAQTANIQMTIGGGMFNTAISVQSNSQTLLSFSKELSVGSDGYNVEISMKQSLADHIGLNYFSFSHSARYSSDQVSSEGAMQLNDLPETRFSGSYMRQAGDSSTSNHSLAFDISAGALSEWILFRTLTVKGWQHQSNMIPSFSYTVVVDSNEYHLSTENVFTRSSRTTRTNTEIVLRHPHSIQLLGQTLPKRNKLSMECLNKRKGMRIVIEYMSEMLSHPVNLEGNLRFNNGVKLVDGQFKFSKSDNAREDTDAVILLNQDTNGYTLSLDFENPPFVPSFKLVASIIDSSEEVGLDINLNNKVVEETYHVKVSSSEGIFTILVELPGQDAITLQGDIPALLNQVAAIVKRLMSQGGENGLDFIKGVIETESGFDMYIGLSNLFSNTYTLHLVVENDAPTASISIHVQENGVKTADVASISVSLVGGQLVKLHMRANAVLSSMMKNVVGIVESEINNKVDWLSDNIVELVNTLSSAVTGSELVDAQVESAIRYIIAHVKSTRDSGVQLVSEVSRSVTDIVEHGEQDLQNIVHGQIVFLLEKVNSLNSMLLQPIQTIIEKYETDLVATIQSVVTSNLQLPRAAFDICNAGDLFISLVEEAIEKAISYSYVKADSFVFAIRGPVRDLVTVTNDEIIITLPLAFSLDGVSFNDLPTVEETKEWFKQTALSQQLDNMIQLGYSYFDTFYMLQAFYYTPLEEQVPPFKGHAFIADFKHYRTFDGRYYDFVSSCESSHVVAVDGKNGNFTITLTYGDIPTYGVRVGKDLITISADGSVTQNQNNVNLPVTSESGLVALRVGNSIKVRHGDDLSLSFDTTTNLLSVNISPFYFASTGGLLGMFDNEPNFDFVTPAGEQVNDVTQFAYAWEISDVKCSHQNAYVTSMDDRAESACKALYESGDSNFRSCYPIVPPQDFLSACMKTKDDFCKVAKAYQTTCTLKGALVSPPNECLSCDAASGGDLQGGVEQTYNVNSVDMVIIIQENECLNQKGKVLGKFLKKFIKSTVTTFSSVGKAKTNFFMVGYGGPGGLKGAHTYTIKGDKISTNRKSDIPKRIRHLSLSRSGAAHDGMAAVEYASKLPFRAGSQQVFVHVMCDACTPESAVSASAVSSLLAARNIVYHYLPLNKITTRERSSKQIYGYDSSRSYIKKSRNVNLNQIRPDEADICIPVATSTGGAVWDGNLMKSNDFVNVITHHISENLPSVERQTCSCQLDEFGEVAAKCV